MIDIIVDAVLDIGCGAVGIRYCVQIFPISCNTGDVRYTYINLN